MLWFACCRDKSRFVLCPEMLIKNFNSVGAVIGRLYVEVCFMKKLKCPCCGFYTIEDDGCLIITDICDVCYWQYDLTAQENPDKAIGPNHGVSLNQARENYCKFKASREDVKRYVRPQRDDERNI